ncbi:MAG: hypothetical protein N2485_00795 [bacterium]|nr:hypothetical protein [bacterium]
MIYKEDGLGDSLFCIPFLKYLNDTNSNKIEIYFYSKYSNFLNSVFEGDLKNIEFINKDVLNYTNFNITIFLGPIAKFFKDIITIKSKRKYSIIYKNKLLTNLVLNFFTNTIFFEEINSVLDHEVFNLFNLVFYILKIENLFDINLSNNLRKYILSLYDFENFNNFKLKIEKLNSENFNYFKNFKYPNGYIILHITYKSFLNGISIDDYYDLLKKIIKLGKKIFLVFGPLELKYLDNFKDIQSNDIIIVSNIDLIEYVLICNKADVFIGFDTGACHLAAFSKTKKIISLYPNKIFSYNSIRYSPISIYSKVINLPYSSLKDVINFIT